MAQRAKTIACPNCEAVVTVEPHASVISCEQCSYAIARPYRGLFRFKIRKIW